MASKIVKIFLRLFIFIGMMSSINSKTFNYQQTLANSGFQSSEHQVLFQKIVFYAATVQYQHVVIPIPLWETIQELLKISDNLEKQQQQIGKSIDPYAKDKANLIDSARKRIAKVINNIKDIIESLPEDQRLTKRMLDGIFGSVGTLMGMFNSWEINRIAKGVGENSRKINTIIIQSARVMPRITSGLSPPQTTRHTDMRKFQTTNLSMSSSSRLSRRWLTVSHFKSFAIRVKTLAGLSFQSLLLWASFCFCRRPCTTLFWFCAPTPNFVWAYLFAKYSEMLLNLSSNIVVSNLPK